MITEECEFTNSVDRDIHASITEYDHGVVEIVHGDESMGYDPLSFKTVRDFKTFLKMLLRFDERL